MPQTPDGVKTCRSVYAMGGVCLLSLPQDCLAGNPVAGLEELLADCSITPWRLYTLCSTQWRTRHLWMLATAYGCWHWCSTSQPRATFHQHHHTTHAGCTSFPWEANSAILQYKPSQCWYMSVLSSVYSCLKESRADRGPSRLCTAAISLYLPSEKAHSFPLWSFQLPPAGKLKLPEHIPSEEYAHQLLLAS